MSKRKRVLREQLPPELNHEVRCEPCGWEGRRNDTLAIRDYAKSAGKCPVCHSKRVYETELAEEQAA